MGRMVAGVVAEVNKFYVVRTVHFVMKLCNDQRNAQVCLFIYLSTSALHVSGFLLAHFRRQVYNFGSGSSLLGMVSASRRLHHTKETVRYVGHYTVRK
jgi:hypothetical protein